MRAFFRLPLGIALWLAACAALLGGAPPPDLDRLRADVTRRPGDAAAQFGLGIALPLPERKQEALAHLEKAIALEPGSVKYGNEYRKVCVRVKEYERSITFLEAQVEAHPDVQALHLNLALAYVDKMPVPTLGIVGQGILSNRSIGELNKVLQKEAGSWAAMYGRAMNHLHWPKVLRHAPQAIEDFRACLWLQAGVPPEKLRPHHLLPYLGLGDAYVKNDQLTEARSVWKEAQKLFPKDVRLAHRLAVGDEDLRQFVDEERGLARPIDTDLSFLWSS